VLHELWDDPASEGRFTFCLSGHRGDDARAMLSPEAQLVWTIDASSHFDAMTRYYEHRGWGTYTTDQEWDYTPYEDLGWEIDGRPLPESPHAEFLTMKLRGSQEPIFVRLRELLPEHGVDVPSAVLAEFFEDDVGQEFGVLVGADKSVHTFVLYYGKGDINSQIRTARIPALTDITHTWETSPYRRHVSEALAFSYLFIAAP